MLAILIRVLMLGSLEIGPSDTGLYTLAHDHEGARGSLSGVSVEGLLFFATHHMSWPARSCLHNPAQYSSPDPSFLARPEIATSLSFSGKVR